MKRAKKDIKLFKAFISDKTEEKKIIPIGLKLELGAVDQLSQFVPIAEKNNLVYG